MAKKVINKKSRVSVIKKRWYDVLAPVVFDKVLVGQTPAADPEKLPGRKIVANLAQFIKAARRQSATVELLITEVKTGKCETELVKMEVSPPQVKRLVRRAKKRVDDSFVVETKDEVKVRLKPLLLVKDSVQKSVLTGLRAATQKFYQEVAKELTYNELVNKIFLQETEKVLKVELRKVYPVSAVYMRAFVKQ
jgi:small subunit ribosomal protein S3Ae